MTSYENLSDVCNYYTVSQKNAPTLKLHGSKL